jgi:Ca2+-binding RTX toxin-like protein
MARDSFPVEGVRSGDPIFSNETEVLVNMRSHRNLEPVAAASAGVEPLEGRLLLSAVLKGSSLALNGTPSNDVITVALNATDATKLDVSDNGTVTSFPLASVKKIKANGKAGNDVITVASAVNIPAMLKGGAGDDNLTGGGASDKLIGGKGDDLLDGGGGDDKVAGGAGSDLYESSDGPSERSGFNEQDDGVRITLDQAPAPVQASVNSVLAGNTATGLSQSVDDNGATIYEVEWTAGGTSHAAEIAADGTVHKQSVTIDPATLPAAVSGAATTKYPKGQITAAEQETLADSSVQYDVEVTNGHAVRALVISPTGTITADELDGHV